MEVEEAVTTSDGHMATASMAVPIGSNGFHQHSAGEAAEILKVVADGPGSNGHKKPVVKIHEVWKTRGGQKYLKDRIFEQRFVDGSYALTSENRGITWVHPPFDPELRERLARLRRDEVLEPRESSKMGGGGGAAGSKAKPKRGSGDPRPLSNEEHAIPGLIGLTFNRATWMVPSGPTFRELRDKYRGMEVIGGAPDSVARRMRLERLRNQIKLQRTAAAKHKKEAVDLRENSFIAGEDAPGTVAELGKASRLERRAELAAYQADCLEAKLGRTKKAPVTSEAGEKKKKGKRNDDEKGGKSRGHGNRG